MHGSEMRGSLLTRSERRGNLVECEAMCQNRGNEDILAILILPAKRLRREITVLL